MIKKKIAILGSTSSIGKSLLDIIKKDQKKFKNNEKRRSMFFLSFKYW